MKQKNIDDIVNLFHGAGLWNDGKFINLVNDYCGQESLDKITIGKALDKAFYDMLATRTTSENAIRFRLKFLIKQ
jgi:hypothetical protein